MSVAIRIIASVPPAIMMVLGFLLIITGSSTDDSTLINFGTWFVIAGVGLQILWIFFGRRRRPF
jgi:hypothetical protein